MQEPTHGDWTEAGRRTSKDMRTSALQPPGTEFHNICMSKEMASPVELPEKNTILPQRQVQPREIPVCGQYRCSISAVINPSGTGKNVGGCAHLEVSEQVRVTPPSTMKSPYI